jgi:ribosomal protein L12E/L44/L45/RPP1/RPP2
MVFAIMENAFVMVIGKAKIVKYIILQDVLKTVIKKANANQEDVIVILVLQDLLVKNLLNVLKDATKKVFAKMVSAIVY